MFNFSSVFRIFLDKKRRKKIFLLRLQITNPPFQSFVNLPKLKQFERKSSRFALQIPSIERELFFPNADASPHEFFDFERHAVGFCLTNKFRVNIKDFQLR